MSQVRMKTFTMITCTLLLLMTFLAGCGSSANQSAGSGQSSTNSASGGSSAGSSAPQGGGEQKKEPATLSLMIGSTGNTYAAMQAVAAEAEKKLNIKIKFDIKPDGGEGDNLVKTRLATGEMSDILAYNSGSLFHALNPTQNFVDLSNEPYVDKLLDSYKQTVTADGKLYGVPIGTTTVGAILYNKKVYEELGLSVPKTWEEFMANNEKIKAAGKTAVITTYKATWTSQLFVLGNHYNVQAQVPNFAEDYTNNKAKFATTPAALRGFQMTREVYDKGYMNEDFLAATYDNGIKMLAEGTGVHYPMLSSALDVLAQNYPDKINDIGVFPIPSDNPEINGLTVWIPSSLYIYSKSKNIDAAKKFLEFFVSDEGVKIWKSVNKGTGPFVIQGVDLPEDAYPAVKDMQPYFDQGKTAPALEFVSPVKGPNLEHILIEVGTGQKTAEQGAKDYDNDVIKQAQQLGLPGW